MRNKKISKFAVGIIVITIFVLLFESLYANRKMFFYNSSPVDVDVSTAEYESDNIQLLENGALQIKTQSNTFNTGQKEEIIFTLPQNSDINAVSFEVEAIDNDKALCSFGFSHENSASQYTFVSIENLTFVNENSNNVVFNFQEYGNVYAIKLTVNTSEPSSFTINKITLNPLPTFQFNVLNTLFLIIVLNGIWALFYFVKNKHIEKIIYDKANNRHKALIRGVVIFCTLIAVMLSFATRVPNFKSVEEVSGVGDVNYETQYPRHFAALLHGQAHLELTPDPDLEELDNVYDNSERLHKNVEFYKDYAYHNGKYYSYFGIAPMVFVHLPVYILTRTVASDALAAAIFGILAIVFICGALEEILLLFEIRTTLLLRLLAIPALCFASGIYWSILSVGVHQTAASCGVFSFCAFIYFSFKGYNSNRKILRRILLFLAGVAAFGIVGSRPIVAVLAIAFCGWVYFAMFVKSFKNKSTLIDLVAFLIPAVIGCSIILFYNYIRFGSMFDFGMAKQFTIFDINAYNVILTPTAFWQMFSLYFVGTNINYVAAYPFVKFDYSYQPILGRYIYQNIPSFGIFNLPLIWGWFGQFKVWSSTPPQKQAMQKWTYRFVTIGVIVSIYLVFVLGGIDLRYMLDFLPALCVLVTLILLQLSLNEIKKGSYTVSWITSALFGLSICTGAVIMFSATSQYPVLYQTLKTMLTIPA